MRRRSFFASLLAALGVRPARAREWNDSEFDDSDWRDSDLLADGMPAGPVPEFSHRTVYVNSNATGANDGTSWANGYLTLAAAIAGEGNTTGLTYLVAAEHDDTATNEVRHIATKAAPDAV